MVDLEPRPADRLLAHFAEEIARCPFATCPACDEKRDLLARVKALQDALRESLDVIATSAEAVLAFQRFAVATRKGGVIINADAAEPARAADHAMAVAIRALQRFDVERIRSLLGAEEGG